MARRVHLHLAVLFLLGSTLMVQAAEISCSTLLSVESTGSRLLKAHESQWLKALSALEGARQPNWEAYSWADTILTATHTGQIKAQDLKPLSSAIQLAAQSFEQSAQKGEARIRTFVDHSYRFFQILNQINKSLKKDIFPNIYLKWAPEDSVLVQQGKETVRQNEKRIRKLYPTTGYGSPSEIVSALENKHIHLPPPFGPRMKTRVQELLDLVNEGLIVTIRRPEGARFWVPLTGFQNQRVTGSSRGTYSPEYRNDVESALTGQNRSDYGKMSVRYQPQYGEARPAFQYKNLTFKSWAERYGSDLWVIKQSVLEERATFTPIDSFSQPRPYGEATRWSQMFIPWIHREIMVPYLLEEAIISGSFGPQTPRHFPLQRMGEGSDYIEVQIWGPVTLDDVQAFVFTRSPAPDEKFVHILKSKGVAVLDARSGTAVPFEVPK